MRSVLNAILPGKVNRVLTLKQYCKQFWVTTFLIFHLFHPQPSWFSFLLNFTQDILDKFDVIYPQNFQFINESRYMSFHAKRSVSTLSQDHSSNDRKCLKEFFNVIGSWKTNKVKAKFNKIIHSPKIWHVTRNQILLLCM